MEEGRGASYLASVEPYMHGTRFPTDPKKCALLVIDVQESFKALLEPVFPNICRLIRRFAQQGEAARLVFTRHGHDVSSDSGCMLQEWWGSLIERGSPKWQFYEPLAALLRDEEEKALKASKRAIVDKSRYSAFFGTNLEEQLEEWGVEEVVICGVLTNCCCETTARDAFMRDYRVYFVADATATTNEDLHVSSLKTLADAFAHVVTTHQLFEHLPPPIKPSEG
ncbi:Isochorismatase domain-containing protein [Balamuthia mandrillaris]